VELVFRFAQEQNGRAEAEHDSREKIREPETDISLSINHANLTRQRADVDHEVEI
jgi:hypothetical protein